MHRAALAVRVAAVWLSLGLALTLSTSAIAGERVVATRVLDGVTHEPLPDAVLAAGARSITTGPDGRVEFSIAPDADVVTVRRIGYRPVEFRAAQVPAVIALERAPVLLQSMEVTAAGSRDLEIGRGSLLDLQSIPRVALSTRAAPALSEALEAAEGISTSRPGSWGAKAYVRGMGGERVAVLLDGNRLNRACNVGMDGGLATINPDNVERVEILSGPGSTLYGSGNVGGVINVVTRAPRAGTPLQGEFRAAGSSAVPGGRAGATLWGGRDRLAFVASLDGASYGDQRSPGGTIEASSFRDATADLAASYAAGKGQLLGAQLQRYSGRDIGYPGAGSAFVPEEDRLLLAVDHAWQASRGFLDGINTKLFLQSLDHHMTMSMVKPPTTPSGASMRTETDATSATDTWGGRAQARLRPGRSLRVDAGFDATRWDAEGTRWIERQRMGTTTTMVLRSWPGVRVTDLGAFTQASFAAAPWLDAGAGARIDRVLRRADGYAQTSEWVPSGNVGVRIGGRRALSARAALGFGYRVPDPTELYGLLLRPDGFVYVGEPELDTERSRSVEFSLGWRTERLGATATVYRNEISEYISTAVRGDSISGIPVRQYRNVADARIDGVSGSLEIRAARWLEWRGTLSSTRGESRGTGAPLPAIAPLEGAVAARAVPGGGWPWIEPELLLAARQKDPALSAGEVETPGFAVLHLRGGRSFGQTGVVAGVENVFDKEYRRHLDPRTIARPGRNFFAKVTQRF